MFAIHNSVAVQRLLNHLQESHAPSPVPAPATERKAKIQRVSKPLSPPSSDSDSESSYSSEDYESPDEIYHRIVEEDKCEYVSPSGLKDKKSKKEAVAYLKEKNCPRIDRAKKTDAPKPTVKKPTVKPAPPTLTITEDTPVGPQPRAKRPATEYQKKLGELMRSDKSLSLKTAHAKVKEMMAKKS